MKATRMLGRVLVPVSLLLLAACQTAPGKKSATAPDPAQAQTQAPAMPQPETTLQAQQQGAPVAVYLADTTLQAGWTPVTIQSGTLYVNSAPVVTRADLTGVQAGASKQGEGLLALQLNEEGRRKVMDITTKNPNKRLALVVGRTMLAAPGYTTPVSSEHLIFAVGTEENATAAARAIAGVPADDVPANAPSTPAATGTPAQ
jgi:preprotein translocase subunit SecD